MHVLLLCLQRSLLNTMVGSIAVLLKMVRLADTCVRWDVWANLTLGEVVMLLLTDAVLCNMMRLHRWCW